MAQKIVVPKPEKNSTVIGPKAFETVTYGWPEDTEITILTNGETARIPAGHKLEVFVSNLSTRYVYDTQAPMDLTGPLAYTHAPSPYPGALERFKNSPSDWIAGVLIGGVISLAFLAAAIITNDPKASTITLLCATVAGALGAFSFHKAIQAGPVHDVISSARDVLKDITDLTTSE